MADVIEPSMFRIPAMQNLEKFSVSSPIWTCADDFHMRSSNFPKLTTVVMEGISVSLFQKLTNPARTRLRGVASVMVSLVNEILPVEYFSSSVTLDKEKLERIHWAFRNMTKLDICICGTETSGLKYIFFEMEKLTSLGISVKHSLPRLTCGDWTSLFTGIPVGIVEGLQENPDFWDSCEVREDAINYPPITRLKGMTYILCN